MQLNKKKWALFVIIATFPLLSGCFGGNVAPEPVPSAPSNLTATANSSTQVELSWQDNSSNETSFYIYRKSVTSSTASVSLANSDYLQIGYVGADSSGAYDTEVSPGTTYWYKVTAGNDSGESESSNEVTVTTPGEATAPSAPSNLTGQAISSSEINLTWQDNSSNETGFYVYRKITDNYSIIATMEANATSYNNTNLNPETAYSYKIAAYNDIGESGFSNALCVHTPPEPLEAPSNVIAEAVTYKQINLTWQDNSSDEENFRIACDMGLGPGNNQFLVRLPANTTHYEHQNLQPMREYKYFVIAERNGVDASSERFSATTFVAPVEILEYWLSRGSMRKIYLQGYLKSEATEPCSVKLKAEYHIFNDYGYSEWDTCAYTVELEALADNMFFEFEYIIMAETGGDKSVECELEITDVEIEY